MGKENKINNKIIENKYMIDNKDIQTVNSKNKKEHCIFNNTFNKQKENNRYNDSKIT